MESWQFTDLYCRIEEVFHKYGESVKFCSTPDQASKFSNQCKSLIGSETVIKFVNYKNLVLDGILSTGFSSKAYISTFLFWKENHMYTNIHSI